MKSKFKTLILTFVFSLLYLTSSLGDEFNFDITELRVTESGNIITGHDGGVVTTRNNEVMIKADNFRYNKLTKFLKAEGNVWLIDKIADVIIESNELFYLKDKEEIYTKGSSRALKGNYIEINSDE